MEDRATFLRGDEILARTRETLAETIRRLEEAQVAAGNERTRLFIETVEREQRRLQSDLEAYEAQAPSHVLERRSQYTLEIPPQLTAPPEKNDVAGVAEWLLAVNEKLAALYDDLAEQAEDPATVEACRALCNLVRAHDRRIANEACQAFDL